MFIIGVDIPLTNLYISNLQIGICKQMSLARYSRYFWYIVFFHLAFLRYESKYEDNRKIEILRQKSPVGAFGHM